LLTEGLLIEPLTGSPIIDDLFDYDCGVEGDPEELEDEEEESSELVSSMPSWLCRNVFILGSENIPAPPLRDNSPGSNDELSTLVCKENLYPLGPPNL
jgi:hypothetical protein